VTKPIGSVNLIRNTNSDLFTTLIPGAPHRDAPKRAIII
jgi:hypothetical protein